MGSPSRRSRSRSTRTAEPTPTFYRWANAPESGLAPIFPATLLLHERLNNDPELVEQIRSFWAGDPLPVSVVRRALRQIGEAAAFSVKAVPARYLSEQRFRFVSGLIRAAGYAGWVLLLDEVELIGRYSLLQRGRSYAQLARWLGHVDGAGVPGLAAVAAITDDFALNVLDEKHDRDYVGARFRDRGSEEDLLIAARAETGMRLIAAEAIRLDPPTDGTLRLTYERIRGVHAAAYGWEPPDDRGGRGVAQPSDAIARPPLDPRVGPGPTLPGSSGPRPQEQEFMPLVRRGSRDGGTRGGRSANRA